MPFENQQSTTIPPVQTAAIRKIVERLLSDIKVPYIVTAYNQRLHDLCCERAVAQGYPMETSSSVLSLRPFIPSGVTLAAIAYEHIESEETRVFIALFTALTVYVDDTYESENSAVRVFIERFVRGEKQMEPVLDGLARCLLEISEYYEPVAANIILTSALNFINSSTLEFQTRGMQVSLYANSYAAFTRQMSGLSAGYVLMAFPRHIPMQNYIQCIPEAVDFLGYANDVFSFYKEEIVGETVNYVSVLARSQGVSNMSAFEQTAIGVARLDTQLCKILEASQEAYDAWEKFKVGYVGFHTSFDRYRLNELMAN